MSEDELLQAEILELLAQEYDKNPHHNIRKEFLLENLDLKDNKLEGLILRLESKGIVKLTRYIGGWFVRLSPMGYEYYINLLEKTENEDDSEPLELEVTSDNFRGIMDVFISHKFVKEDQTLASILRKHLRGKGVEGYLAETRREYDLLISEKIKNEIEASDYLVGIITKNSLLSHSVNQEIGYALGRKIPVILMVEEGATHGVLTHGREIEEFTRSNFDNYCKNVVNFIIEKGARKKISDEERMWLVDNVYRPCYNQMINAYNNREFITYPPSNKWKELEPYAQLRTEPEMKELFENYTKEVETWSDMWIIDFGNKFMEKRDNLGEILRPVFEKHGLLDQRGYLNIGRRSENPPKEWLHNCQDVIFNDDIHDGEELYRILKKDAVRKYGEEYSLFLDEWYRNKPEIYTDILKTIPELVKILGTNYSYRELDEQRNALKKAIEKLYAALEVKLK